MISELLASTEEIEASATERKRFVGQKGTPSWLTEKPPPTARTTV